MKLKELISLLSIFLCLKILGSYLFFIFIVRNDLNQIITDIRSENHISKAQVLENEDIYFSQVPYCARWPQVKFQFSFLASGKIEIKTKILDKQFKKPLPREGEWEILKRGLYVHLVYHSISDEVFSLQNIVVRKSGEVVSFFFDDLVFEHSNC